MKFNAQDITSFLTFRYPISSLKNYKYPYTSSFKEILIAFDTAKAQTESLLLASVKNLMEKSDRPAVMISGGLDSILMVALMKYLNPYKKIRLYTAFFNRNPDMVRAKDAAQLFNLLHSFVKIYPNDYIIRNKYLTPLIQLKREPLHPNEIALAKIESMAEKDGCDTVFCGEGADAVFGGYDKLLTFHKKFPRNFSSFLAFYRYFSYKDREIIQPKYLTDDEIMIYNFWGNSGGYSGFRNMIHYFIQKFHTPGLLKRGINAAKYNNLDIAFPYIDKDLFSFVNSLPFEYKIFGATSKYILREIALKYISSRFAYAKKYPFPVPFERWLKNTDEWDLNKKLFLSNNISNFSGWHKWMLINLNTWMEATYEE